MTGPVEFNRARRARFPVDPEVGRRVTHPDPPFLLGLAGLIVVEVAGIQIRIGPPGNIHAAATE